jgi:Flp pilus assembly protein TadD
VELDPKNPDFVDTLGWVLFRRGVYEAAVTHLERAASIKPTAVRHYHLAMAYYKAGKEERGRTALLAGLRIDPTLPEAKAAQQLMGSLGVAANGR